MWVRIIWMDKEFPTIIRHKTQSPFVFFPFWSLSWNNSWMCDEWIIKLRARRTCREVYAGRHKSTPAWEKRRKGERFVFVGKAAAGEISLRMKLTASCWPVTKAYHFFISTTIPCFSLFLSPALSLSLIAHIQAFAVQPEKRNESFPQS